MPLHNTRTSDKSRVIHATRSKFIARKKNNDIFHQDAMRTAKFVRVVNRVHKVRRGHTKSKHSLRRTNTNKDVWCGVTKYSSTLKVRYCYHTDIQFHNKIPYTTETHYNKIIGPTERKLKGYNKNAWLLLNPRLWEI